MADSMTTAELRRRALRVVRVVEVEVPLGEDDPATLRIEILATTGETPRYAARVWRLEHFRIQSTFPQTNGTPQHPPSDEVILKELEGVPPLLMESTSFSSVDEAEEHVLGKLAEWLADHRGER